MGIYDLDYDVKSFAIANDFVINTNKVCYALGQQLRPFCIYGRDIQKQEGVMDFADFAGLININKMLVDEIAEFRAETYKAQGLSFDITNKNTSKLLFIEYLMSVSMCYVEIPKYVTKNGVGQATYDKFLCTRNPKIMGVWMGMDSSDMKSKYSSKLTLNPAELSCNELRFVKLNNSAKGNSITVPRKSFSIEKMVCIPVYMLYAFTEGFKTHLSDGIVKFSYLKDNGTVRELPTTLSSEILNSIYDNTTFVNTMLSGVDINTNKQGGMTFSSHFNRGYIKVPEVGASIYDGTGVRSLNLARLIKAEKVNVSDLDLTCVKVDLNSVVDNFYKSLDYILKNMPNELFKVYRELTGEACKSFTSQEVVTDIWSYTEKMKVILSTTFNKSLHKFMVSHLEWFPYYTGTPAENIISSKNFGVSEDFDF